MKILGSVQSDLSSMSVKITLNCNKILCIQQAKQFDIQFVSLPFSQKVIAAPQLYSSFFIVPVSCFLLLLII